MPITREEFDNLKPALLVFLEDHADQAFSWEELQNTFPIDKPPYVDLQGSVFEYQKQGILDVRVGPALNVQGFLTTYISVNKHWREAQRKDRK